MKKIFLLSVLLVSCFAAAAKPYTIKDIPNVQRQDVRRYTSNPDGVLDAGTVARLDELCLSMRQRGLAQVAVVAVKQIDGDDTFTFAYELFSKWGVGKRELSNGLGILLVTERREVRIVTGYGLEGVLTDALCRRIIETYMIPEFRTGDYGAGLVAGVEAADKLLSGSELDTGEGENLFSRENLERYWAIAAIVGLLLLRGLFGALGRKRKDGENGDKDGEEHNSGAGGALIGFLLGSLLSGGRGGGSRGGSFGGGGFGGGGAGGRF